SDSVRGSGQLEPPALPPVRCGGERVDRVAARVDHVDDAVAGHRVRRPGTRVHRCEPPESASVQKRQSVGTDVDDGHVIAYGGEPGWLLEAADPRHDMVAGDYRHAPAELVADEDAPA